MATKDEEDKGEASSAYTVSSTLIEKGGGKDTEIIYYSMDLLFKSILKANPILSQTILSRCLKFCYLFPKSYEFYMDDIIHMWIAQEFILPMEVSNRQMEDTGRICFEEFTHMHIFQLSCTDSFTGQLRYTLNQSIFKLLQMEHDDGYTKLELEDIESPMSVITLHSSLCYSYTDQIAIDLKNFQSANGLRTLLILHDHQGSSGLNHVPRDFFQKLPCLWVLDMSHTNITELPSSIGCLKQLRYLNLSGTPITTLPNSLCSLYQMQTLNLRGCLNLIRLPKGISKLINLRHLDMDVSCLLLSMPPGIGDLVKLQTLAAFVVGKQNGCRITELKNMVNLRGTLSILRLENTTSSEEAKEATLDKKQYLDKLDLHWTELQDGLELLENLQPHTQVQELEIVGYGGIKFPNWMGDPLFSKLSTISLHGCRKCELLPPLGKLPSLKSLCISDMDAVKTVDHHFYGRNMDSKNSDLVGLELEAVTHNASMFNAFLSLEKLTINAMNKLELWIGMEEGDFPHLLKLNISGCSKLTTLPKLLLLYSLKQLEISLCPLLKSLPNEGLPNLLQYFIIIDCPLLKERCRKDEGHDWGMLIDIPNVWIDYEQVSQSSDDSTERLSQLDASRDEHIHGSSHQTYSAAGSREDRFRWKDDTPLVDRRGTLVVHQNVDPSIRNHEEIQHYSGNNNVNGPLKVYPGGQAGVDNTGVSQFSSPSSRSISPRRYQREGDYDLENTSSLSVMPKSDLQNSLWKLDLMLKVREQEEEILQLRKHLADYSVKEAQICNEKHVLEKRIAHMRMAFDQKQQELVDATSKSSSYRQDLIEKITYALQNPDDSIGRLSQLDASRYAHICGPSYQPYSAAGSQEDRFKWKEDTSLVDRRGTLVVHQNVSHKNVDPSIRNHDESQHYYENSTVFHKMEGEIGNLGNRLTGFGVNDSSSAPSNENSMFQVMKAVEAAENTIKQQVEENKRLRAELQKRTLELERHGFVTKLELSANMIEEDEKRKLETAKLQPRFDHLLIMEDCKPTIPVVKGEENVITATQNFVRPLETNSKVISLENDGEAHT